MNPSFEDPLSVLCRFDVPSNDLYEFLLNGTSKRARFYRWVKKMKKQWNIEENLIITTIVGVVLQFCGCATIVAHFEKNNNLCLNDVYMNKLIKKIKPTSRHENEWNSSNDKNDMSSPKPNIFSRLFKSNRTTSSTNLKIRNCDPFVTAAFLDLEDKVYGDAWAISCKRDGVLGQCLLSATKLARVGVADQDEYCKKFMEILIPDAFRKLQCSHKVTIWDMKVQLGVFDMVELLIDLIAARLSYFPVPVQLLETLAIIFDPDSTFHIKHKNKPYNHLLYDEKLGERKLANSSLTSTIPIYNRNEPYGWLCQIINHFVLKDGIQNLKKQFKSEKPLTAIEYNALFLPFANCLNYIFIDKYRLLFNEHIEQVLIWIGNLKVEDFLVESTTATCELLSTLRKICSVVWPNHLAQVQELHLNLLLQMLTQSNFHVKINSLKQIEKLIENCTSDIQSIVKASIPHGAVIEWIITYSILLIALEGNIDQNEYVESVRPLLVFIAPRLCREDIELIWSLQFGRSLVEVDHLFTLIASVATKFKLEHFNHLINLIYNSWKTETIPIQEKLIELLGTIGRECQKDSAFRILEILWNMAHEDTISRLILDRVLNCHLRIFSESRSPYYEARGDYCLKCMTDLQQLKQGWIVPAVKHLHELLRYNSTNTFDSSEKGFMLLLISKRNLFSILFKSLSTCQSNFWNKAQEHVTIDTLVDGRYTYEESIKSHLDLLSFLLEKGNIYLILTRCEQLWDILITNENPSSFIRELGFNWFIKCIDYLDRATQIALFDKRIIKLNLDDLSPEGLNCFQLYFERCTPKQPDQSKNSNLDTSISANQQSQPAKNVKTISATVGNGVIEFQNGDITTQKVDVVIGSSSSEILRKAIIEVAGDEVQTAYDAEYKNNPDNILISTLPGNLPCKRIFFVKWPPATDEAKLRELIVDVMWTVIHNVLENNFTTLAFPVIICGKRSCSADILVKTIVNEMKVQLGNNDLPFTVKFIIQATQQDFCGESCKEVLTTQEEDVRETVNYQLPTTWEKSNNNKIRFELAKTSEEYELVAINFDQAMQGYYTQIVRIERIQNERWYIQYLAHSRNFKGRLKRDTEKCLYHGCPERAANSIVEDCFNRSFAGVNGTVYGVGVYFSASAVYSHQYAIPNAKGERSMFLARVLLGNTTIGNALMKTRPAGFDSTTDGIHIVVTYHDAQAYGDYLITYK